MHIFLSGVLQHPALLEIVLGRDPATTVVEDGLPDHRLCLAQNGSEPVLMPAADCHVNGLRLDDAGQEDVARLKFYLADFDLSKMPQTLSSGAAAYVFQPKALPALQDAAWSFDTWQDQYAPLACVAGEEIMSLYGTVSIEELASQRPRILARAQSRLNARSSRHGERTLQGKIEMEYVKRTHFPFFAFDQFGFRHETFSGGMSDVIERGVFVPTDAAIVLPYDPLTDRVLLVEQVRTGPIARGDSALWQLEPVAGLIDPGEGPEETARREAREEAGLELHSLEPVAENYTSPGGSSDFQFLYIGLCSLPDVESRLGGLACEGEDIRSHIISFDTLFSMAERITIANMPLTLSIYWLAAHRSRLRSAYGKATSGRQT